ncbi:GIY-YIG nuclease family protein [Candidatus Parcubacteria bacterium]|nr:MAG: GIY-YIG nuclease family protein [Candidatus Parcubacteria bacterium]
MNPVRDAGKWCVYVLQSAKDNKWYTGFTNDLRKRLKEHRDGLARSTKGRGLLELIYYEMCLHRHDARSRELFLKSGMGKRYLHNRLRRFLSLTG